MAGCCEKRQGSKGEICIEYENFGKTDCPWVKKSTLLYDIVQISRVIYPIVFTQHFLN